MRDSCVPQVPLFPVIRVRRTVFWPYELRQAQKKADPEWTSPAQEPLGSDQIRSNFAGLYRKPAPFISVSIASAPITCSHTVSHSVTVPGT